MDIRKRINARKIVLSYFYQRCFFSALSKKPVVEEFPRENQALEDSVEERKEEAFLSTDFLNAVEQKKQEAEQWWEVVRAQINAYALWEAIDEDLAYIVRYFFDQWGSEEIDMEYVLRMGNAFSLYESVLKEKVDRHVQSFWYERMDIMDQVLFLLWYIEYRLFATPKEVILNEMVELAKRYSDEGAPKLLNGVLHAIFQEE